MNRREAMQTILVGAGAMTCMTATEAASENAKRANSTDPIERDDLCFWLETSLKRVFPNSPPGSAAPLHLLAARNERLSFQACFRNKRTTMTRVRLSVQDDPDCSVLIRRVGYVPLQGLNTATPKSDLEGIGHIPGLAPDPLYPEDAASVGPEANGVFWITVKTSPDAAPGLRTVNVRFTFEDEFDYVGWLGSPPFSVEIPVQIEICPLVIQPRHDFPTTHWINIESIWDYYRIAPFSERFWELAEAYIANMVEHNLDVVYTPIFNARHELMPRPGQLLRVRRIDEDQYEFDFTDVRKWVQVALKHGAKCLEFTHFFTPAPTSGRHPQRIFHRWPHTRDILWSPDISATSSVYRNFLSQFLPQFERFLKDENIFDRSYFHCADEPDGAEQIADYRKARELLREFAPWMKVIDAMSDTHFAVERLTDMPIPSIVTAPEFTKAGCPAWTYFCCGPRGAFLQRLHDTPLPKIRMAGWLFYRLGAKGFLHWGHNYWYVFCTGTIADPYKDPAVGAYPGLPYGDPFVVYPGANGPVDSIRWEVFAESLQDYALLQSAGIAPDDSLLDSLGDYQDFPKSEQWLADARRRILKES